MVHNAYNIKIYHRLQRNIFPVLEAKKYFFPFQIFRDAKHDLANWLPNTSVKNHLWMGIKFMTSILITKTLHKLLLLVQSLDDSFTSLKEQKSGTPIQVGSTKKVFILKLSEQLSQPNISPSQGTIFLIKQLKIFP